MNKKRSKKTMSNFWRNALSAENVVSSKRLVTLIISLHFIIASFVTLFIAFYVIFYMPKGRVEPELLGLLKQVLEYDFYIILSGLGFITADSVTMMIIEKAKAQAAARYGTFSSGFTSFSGGMGDLPPYRPITEQEDKPDE